MMPIADRYTVLYCTVLLITPKDEVLLAWSFHVLILTWPLTISFSTALIQVKFQAR